MFKMLFRDATLLELPLVVMLGFMVMFAGVVVWTYSRRRRGHYDHMSHLPLDLERDPRDQDDSLQFDNSTHRGARS